MSEASSADRFHDLRNRVFDLANDDEFARSVGSEIPLAVLLETDLGRASYTLVAAGDGGTSMYFSNGGGLMGAGEHATVREAATNFLHLAMEYLPHFKNTQSRSLPTNMKSKFYIIVKGAIFVSADFDETEIETSTLKPLYAQAQEVITQIRLLAPESR
jgi:hypothetical protein